MENLAKLSLLFVLIVGTALLIGLALVWGHGAS
jgi:hypothetical protein